jgi:hypothetical protein
LQDGFHGEIGKIRFRRSTPLCYGSFDSSKPIPVRRKQFPVRDENIPLFRAEQGIRPHRIEVAKELPAFCRTGICQQGFEITTGFGVSERPTDGQFCKIPC